MYFSHLYVCASDVFSVLRDHKRASNPWKLEVAVNYRVDWE